MTAVDDLADILAVATLIRRYGSCHNADALRYAIDPALLAAASGLNRSALISAVTSQVQERGRDPVDPRVISRCVDDAISGASANANSTSPPVATPEGEAT